MKKSDFMCSVYVLSEFLLLAASECFIAFELRLSNVLGYICKGVLNYFRNCFIDRIF